jgi:hypothetical protein
MSFWRGDTTHAEAAALVEVFVGILESRLSITVASGSDLEDICLRVSSLPDPDGGDVAFKGLDIRPVWARVGSLINLMRLTIATDQGSGLHPFREHLKELNGSGAVAMNSPSRFADSTSKVFELLVGLAAAQFAENVTMDHPSASVGDNPDVLASWGGTRWGIACKLPVSKSPRQIFRNVEDGTAQVLASPCERGVVILNLKNIVEHERWWGLALDGQGELDYEILESLDEALARIKLEVRRIECSMDEEIGVAFVRTVLCQPRMVPAVLLHVATATGLRIAGSPVPTYFTSHWLWCGEEPNSLDRDFLSRLDRSLQNR